MFGRRRVPVLHRRGTGAANSKRFRGIRTWMVRAQKTPPPFSWAAELCLLVAPWRGVQPAGWLDATSAGGTFADPNFTFGSIGFSEESIFEILLRWSHVGLAPPAAVLERPAFPWAAGHPAAERRRSLGSRAQGAIGRNAACTMLDAAPGSAQLELRAAAHLSRAGCTPVVSGRYPAGPFRVESSSPPFAAQSRSQRAFLARVYSQLRRGRVKPDVAVPRATFRSSVRER